MPVVQHPVFDRPLVTTSLWRYTDLPKFIELLTSQSLWLSNLEVLAQDDPYEGTPDAIQFPHRMWKNIDEVPEPLKEQIIYMEGSKSPPEQAFRNWFMLREQQCIFEAFGRRQYFINCWHASNHESAAMWKIYSSPGAGVAILTNGARIENALSVNDHSLYLGSVKYQEHNTFEIGRGNGFDSVIAKRASYKYEHEVRLVYWDTNDFHDPLRNFSWNEDRMRFDEILEDPRNLTSGISLTCDVGVLIEKVIVSPMAPAWYLPMIERLRDRLGFQFPVVASELLTAPKVIP